MKLFFRVLFFLVLTGSFGVCSFSDQRGHDESQCTLFDHRSLIARVSPSPFSFESTVSPHFWDSFSFPFFFLSFLSKRNSRSQTLLFREWKNLGIWEKSRSDHGGLVDFVSERKDWKEQFLYVRKDHLKQRRESSSTVFLDYHNGSLFPSSSFKYKLQIFFFFEILRDFFRSTNANARSTWNMFLNSRRINAFNPRWRESTTYTQIRLNTDKVDECAKDWTRQNWWAVSRGRLPPSNTRSSKRTWGSPLAILTR